MKTYKVLTDTWLRGRPYASGATAILGEADGYVRAGLIQPLDEEPAAPAAEEQEPAPEVTPEVTPEKTRRRRRV
jgi:hypothetical protein